MEKIINPFINYEGFNCFGCSPDNSFGLKMEFVDEGDFFVSHWEPQDRFQGYNHILHGGIQATLMDEIASWYIYAKLGTGGVTAKMETRHKKPIYTNRGKLLIKAWLKEKSSRIASINVEIYNNDGSLGATGIIDYFILPPEQAKEKLKYPGKEAFYLAK
ncbi:MAG: PaaI family thioesterase [Bacteroidales bacterium]|nr:PaaI family thioesterase [Bacteroidales bacterium]MCF8389370.1 PaaI family thioesterase [Bacteroidales bacterium]